MVGTNATTVAVIPDPLDSVQTNPAAWLDKTFIAVERPRAVSVTFAEAAKSWKLTRTTEANGWQLAEAKADEKLDPAKASGITTAFNGLSFNDVAAKSDNPAVFDTVLTVETFDGFSYVVKIGDRKDDYYPVTLSVAAELATFRTAGKDEKPADKTKLDQEFKDRQAVLTEKLAKEKRLEGWIYHLPASAIDSLTKPRKEFLVEVKKEQPPPKPGK
jgi:hypothetical protein